MSLPVISLVGRPNVGKSTLFNRLTRSRDALVADEPGLTRDRKYGKIHCDGHRLLVVDTGGIGEVSTAIDQLVSEQTTLAIEESDVIFFIVDAQAGVMPGDGLIASVLRKGAKRVYLLVNKAEGRNEELAKADFFALGMGEPLAISATHGWQVQDVMEEVLKDLGLLAIEPPDFEREVPASQEKKIVIAGRPNVGKSTLVNALLGEERVLASETPGTTRDSIEIPFNYHSKTYILIDTAGVRRKGKVTETVEKFSAIKALQAIETAHIIVFLLDATEGITEQDASLLGYIHDTGKALVIGVNKSEDLGFNQQNLFKDEIAYRLHFVSYARIVMISALQLQGLDKLMSAVDQSLKSAYLDVSTTVLTELLAQALQQHQPPLIRGRRIKLRYAHQGGKNPLRIIIHGNQTQSVMLTYARFLVGFFRESLGLVGTSLKLEFKSSVNPFAGRRNELSPRQQKRRTRIVKHAKKSRRKSKN